MTKGRYSRGDRCQRDSIRYIGTSSHSVLIDWWTLESLHVTDGVPR